ncbi:MAG TPA: ACP S-malonyltransferase [Phycisphaerae bacterium]|nr:ACP S-malonyltransferase [Phycisphaerae bacterium]HRY69379.1 ACP S-malonyltransferase [Phycisphaerae bacterium]HSA26246.1 ACP S-malonyltransferase [Phycisphaerae bacterium]
MARTAVLFTGQGAQSVGMGKDIAQRSGPAAEIFERAARIVGYDLRALCFEGPADRLEQTDIQQPAIFTTSVAIWQAMTNNRQWAAPPVAMAGLSLGEYTALYAAGAVSFDDALRLVQRRGELMQAAAVATPSGMVSALGLDLTQVETVCRSAAAAGLLVPANFNCPGQIVLSGTRAACEAAVPLIEQAGGRAIPLKVAGAFHSPIMQSAADGLAEVLARTPLQTPAFPVVANVNCENHRDAVTIRQWLADQLTHPVRWQASIERLLNEGVERFIEVGPGRVLAGLLKKIARRTPVVNVSTVEGLEEFYAS